MFIVDFVLRDYLDVKFGRLNAGFNKYINFLYENFEDIAINQISPLKSNIKDYLIICNHMVLYFIKKKDNKKANDLFDKLSGIALDEKKDKDLLYLKNKNAALLNKADININDVLTDENIVYNGLDIFSKVTEDYIEIEKDSKHILETKAKRDKRRKERAEKSDNILKEKEDTKKSKNKKKKSEKSLNDNIKDDKSEKLEQEDTSNKDEKLDTLDNEIQKDETLNKEALDNEDSSKSEN